MPRLIIRKHVVSLENCVMDLPSVAKRYRIKVIASPAYKLESELLTVQQMGRSTGEILALFNSGKVKLLNSFGPMEMMALKDIIYASLSEQQIPIPLTLAIQGGDALWMQGGNTTRHNNFSPAFILEMISLYRQRTDYLVIKKSCEHRGEGVRVVPVEQKHIQSLESGLVQEFVAPPFEDRYMRDIRVVMIGGQPVDMYMRRAAEPLDLDNGKVPTKEQYLTNVIQGGKIEDVPDDLREICRLAAEHAYGAFMREATQFQAKTRLRLPIDEPDVRFDYGVIDFLINRDWVPLVCEIDKNPNMKGFWEKNKKMQAAFAATAQNLAGSGRIGLYGFDHATRILARYLLAENVDFRILVPKYDEVKR